MGRMSAYVLVGLPFFMAAVVTLMNPTYMAPLWHTGVGHTMVVAGLVMIGARKPDAQEDRRPSGGNRRATRTRHSLCFAGAVFAAAEVATYPARLKERSIQRATEYGRVRIPDKADELLRFRERVLMPAACAARRDPAEAQPAHERRVDRQPACRRPGSRSGSRPRSFLAIKGAGLDRRRAPRRC